MAMKISELLSLCYIITQLAIGLRSIESFPMNVSHDKLYDIYLLCSILFV